MTTGVTVTLTPPLGRYQRFIVVAPIVVLAFDVVAEA